MTTANEDREMTVHKFTPMSELNLLCKICRETEHLGNHKQYTWHSKKKVKERGYM